MKERSLILRDYEVRAVLAGTKTQHRLVLKPQPDGRDEVAWCEHSQNWIVGRMRDSENAWRKIKFPFEVGMRLWVKETWGCKDADAPGIPDGRKPQQGDSIQYAANDADAWQWRVPGALPWRSSTHMPRWASRISLEVKRVWPERLQDISEADVCAEGIGSPLTRECKVPAFARYWDQRHVKKPSCSWAANPWIGVTEFKRVTDK